MNCGSDYNRARVIDFYKRARFANSSPSKFEPYETRRRSQHQPASQQRNMMMETLETRTTQRRHNNDRHDATVLIKTRYGKLWPRCGRLRRKRNTAL